MTTNCRFVATDEPRVLSRRHTDACQGAGPYWHPPMEWVDCSGCQPCPELHCVVCGRNHAPVTCTDCLEAARGDLAAIGDLCHTLPAEAVQRGVNSEAMMLLGPASDPEAWRNRATSAAMGRLSAAYLEDCRDELHPLWVLGTWEQVWRDHLDHPTDQRVTLASAWTYLDTQIAYMAEQPEPAFEEFARELRGCRSHLEDVLRDGIREERGVPCRDCGTNLTREAQSAAACKHSRQAMLMATAEEFTSDEAVVMLRRLLLAYPEMAAEHGKCSQGGLAEHYECKPCRRKYSEAEYWLAVRSRLEEVS